MARQGPCSGLDNDGVGAGCCGLCAPNPHLEGGFQEGFLEEVIYLSTTLKDECELARCDIEDIPS